MLREGTYTTEITDIDEPFKKEHPLWLFGFQYML